MKTINVLFILASVMENVIINEKNPEYRHLAKMRFNRIVKEIKAINKEFEEVLSEKDLENFDNCTNQIVYLINEILKD